MSNTYDVKIVRDGKWWMVEIPEIDGLTQARRIGEATTMAAEYIALRTDTPVDDVRVAVSSVIVDGAEYAERQKRLDEAREAQARAEALVQKEQSELARELVSEDVPLRDIGEIVGVSYQRVHQLVSH